MPGAASVAPWSGIMLGNLLCIQVDIMLCILFGISLCIWLRSGRRLHREQRTRRVWGRVVRRMESVVRRAQ